MGRAKLEMELISNQKSRINTFKKRKQGLLRKIHEFTTLCDVSACMIIYGPDQNPGSSEPETWPDDRKEVDRVIGLYRAKNKESGHSNYGLPEYLNDRKRKIEDDLSRLRKKNMEAKYPTKLDSMEPVPESWLRDFAATLRIKADYVKSRIDFLKQGLIVNSSNAGLMNMAAASDQSQIQVPNFYSPLFDTNSFFQFGAGDGGGLSADFWRGPYEQGRGGFYEFGPTPLGQYCGGPVQWVDMSPGPLLYTQMGPQLTNDGAGGGAGDVEGLQMVFNNTTNYTGSRFNDF